MINIISAFILKDHHHDHDHDHHHNHNLHAAYMQHVLADAFTSLLAIVALVSGKYFGGYWLDPIMGIVGAIISIVTHYPKPTEEYKNLLAKFHKLSHLTIEVHTCEEKPCIAVS